MDARKQSDKNETDRRDVEQRETQAPILAMGPASSNSDSAVGMAELSSRISTDHERLAPRASLSAPLASVFCVPSRQRERLPIAAIASDTSGAQVDKSADVTGIS